MVLCHIIILLSSSMTVYAEVTMDWVTIGNPGNSADSNTFGAVDYIYQVSTYEVTTTQYVEFLNSVAKSDPNGLYNTNMNSSFWFKGITRSGTSGSYSYSVNSGWGNKPIGYVSVSDAFRFVNWLTNGQKTTSQMYNVTEIGTYTMSEGSTLVRSDGATVFLPSIDEWYKAGYFDPTLNSGAGAYWDYATGNNIQPDNNAPASDSGNSVNYRLNKGYAVGSPYYSTDVKSYQDSASPYGTFDQNGNIYEFSDSFYGSLRWILGGRWSDTTDYNMSSSNLGTNVGMTVESEATGFRVARLYSETTIPEPTTFLLGCLLGCLFGCLFGCIMFIRKRFEK